MAIVLIATLDACSNRLAVDGYRDIKFGMDMVAAKKALDSRGITYTAEQSFIAYNDPVSHARISAAFSELGVKFINLSYGRASWETPRTPYCGETFMKAKSDLESLFGDPEKKTTYWEPSRRKRTLIWRSNLGTVRVEEVGSQNDCAMFSADLFNGNEQDMDAYIHDMGLRVMGY